MCDFGVRFAGFFFVFQKWLRAQRVGRVAPRRGGAKRRAAALGAAQRPKAPPQAAERRAADEACFSAFSFAAIIDKEKELTEKSVGNYPILRQRQSLGSICYDLHRQYESSGSTRSTSLRKYECFTANPPVTCNARPYCLKMHCRSPVRIKFTNSGGLSNLIYETSMNPALRAYIQFFATASKQLHTMENGRLTPYLARYYPYTH